MRVWRILILVGTLAAAPGAAGAEFDEAILFNPGLGGYPRLRNASLIPWSTRGPAGSRHNRARRHRAPTRQRAPA